MHNGIEPDQPSPWLAARPLSSSCTAAPSQYNKMSHRPNCWTKGNLTFYFLTDFYVYYGCFTIYVVELLCSGFGLMWFWLDLLGFKKQVPIGEWRIARNKY